MAGSRGNIIDDIIADHREFESVFVEIESSDDPRTQPELVEHVISGIVRHAVAEEQYVYPAARSVLPDGDEVADHELEEHAEAEEVMKAIEKTDPEDSDSQAPDREHRHSRYRDYRAVNLSCTLLCRAT